MDVRETEGRNDLERSANPQCSHIFEPGKGFVMMHSSILPSRTTCTEHCPEVLSFAVISCENSSMTCRPTACTMCRGECGANAHRQSPSARDGMSMSHVRTRIAAQTFPLPRGGAATRHSRHAQGIGAQGYARIPRLCASFHRACEALAYIRARPCGAGCARARPCAGRLSAKRSVMQQPPSPRVPRQ